MPTTTTLARVVLAEPLAMPMGAVGTSVATADACKCAGGGAKADDGENNRPSCDCEGGKAELTLFAVHSVSPFGNLEFFEQLSAPFSYTSLATKSSGGVICVYLLSKMDFALGTSG